jgi:HSP20 family protein
MIIGNFKPVQTGKPIYPQSTVFSQKKMVAIQPAVNIIESATGFQIDIAAPGKQKEHFTVTLERDVLKVIAANNAEIDTQVNEQYIRKEFSFGQFEKTFQLGERVQSDEVKVVYEQGILKITLQKKPAVQAKKISIQ